MKLVIDADHILYLVDHALKNDIDATHNQAKNLFKDKIEEYKDIVDVEGIVKNFKIKKVIVSISDKSNFRYDFYPEYKQNRSCSVRTELFLSLRKWARKKYSPKQNIEADDFVAYHVSKGAIGVTTDKDLFNGVAGLWYNAHHAHRCWISTTKEQADKFVLLQSIMGDSVDNIKGIKRMGVVRATKHLDDNGWTWDSVVKLYNSEEEAVFTRRLVDMHQWTPKKGVTLWVPTKNYKKN